MNFMDRIKSGRAADFIDLTNREQTHYKGCGAVLVCVTGQEISGVLYVGETLTESELEKGDVTRIYREIISPWLKSKGADQIYMGKMSCLQICEPEPYDITKAARLARWIIEEFSE